MSLGGTVMFSNTETTGKTQYTTYVHISTFMNPLVQLAQRVHVHLICTQHRNSKMP